MYSTKIFTTSSKAQIASKKYMSPNSPPQNTFIASQKMKYNLYENEIHIGKTQKLKRIMGY